MYMQYHNQAPSGAAGSQLIKGFRSAWYVTELVDLFFSGMAKKNSVQRYLPVSGKVDVSAAISGGRLQERIH